MPQKQTRQIKSRPGRLNIAVGALCLLTAAAGSGLMSAKHIWALTLPGCAQGGGCDWATNGPWSSVLGFPVAYIGLGFFTALLVIWLATSRQGIWSPLLLPTRIGLVGSIFFSAVMVATGHFCPWCVTVHLANLGFWLTLELTARRSLKARLPLATGFVFGVLIFVIVGGAAKLLERHERQNARELAHQEAEESIAKIGAPDTTTATVVDSATPIKSNAQPVPKPVNRRFGGRFWTGDPSAPVRIVIFQDYQCSLCREAESTLTALIANRNDVSMSVRHWPFDKECNRMIISESMHPGSCLDARAAEAVGRIAGSDVFWKFHRWLFERRGEVKLPEIEQKVAQLGLDGQRFTDALQSPAVDSLLTADIEDGVKYGIRFTPMLFVNGYEVRGWQSAGALPAAIERAAQFARTQPKKDDRPDLAIEKQFQDWQNSRGTTIALRADDHIRGTLSAPTGIVMFGDITEPFNAEATRLINRIVTDTQRVLLVFRTFPLQAECNDMVKRPINPRACEAARVLEAVGLTGGETAYWKAIKWFAANVDHLPADLIQPVAAAAGVGLEPLRTALNDPRISARISANVEAAKQLGVDTSPTVFVNGRRLVDWRTPGMLERVIAATTSQVQLYKRPAR